MLDPFGMPPFGSLGICLNGVDIYTLSDHVNNYAKSVRVKVPRRKNRRIQKKAMKRYGWKTVQMQLIPDGRITNIAGKWYCNRTTLDMLKTGLEKQNVKTV